MVAHVCVSILGQELPPLLLLQVLVSLYPAVARLDKANCYYAARAYVEARCLHTVGP